AVADDLKGGVAEEGEAVVEGFALPGGDVVAVGKEAGLADGGDGGVEVVSEEVLVKQEALLYGGFPRGADDSNGAGAGLIYQCLPDALCLVEGGGVAAGAHDDGVVGAVLEPGD